MFNIGDYVEFYFEGRELFATTRVDVKGKITRVNELGCFVKITNIEPENNLMIGGRTYRLGDELYMLNSSLHLCQEDNITDNTSLFKDNFAWVWVILSIIFILLWFITVTKNLN